MKRMTVYVLSYLREYCNDRPAWGVEGVFMTEVEATARMKEVYNDTLADFIDDDNAYDYDISWWSAHVIGYDFFGWQWEINTQSIDVESSKIPDGVNGSWVPSLEDFEMRGWDVSEVDEKTGEKMLADVNEYMNNNDGVADYYWNTIDMVAEDIFKLKKNPTPAE